MSRLPSSGWCASVWCARLADVAPQKAQLWRGRLAAASAASDSYRARRASGNGRGRVRARPRVTASSRLRSLADRRAPRVTWRLLPRRSRLRGRRRTRAGPTPRVGRPYRGRRGERLSGARATEPGEIGARMHRTKKPRSSDRCPPRPRCHRGSHLCQSRVSCLGRSVAERTRSRWPRLVMIPSWPPWPADIALTRSRDELGAATAQGRSPRMPQVIFARGERRQALAVQALRAAGVPIGEIHSESFSILACESGSKNRPRELPRR